MPSLIRFADTRVLATAAATMRTYVSPTSANESDISVWRSEMQPDTAGPAHSIDTDHIVVIVDGRLDAEIGGERVEAHPGDCVLLRAGTSRRLTAGPTGVTTLTVAVAGSTAAAGESEAVPVPWAN